MLRFGGEMAETRKVIEFDAETYPVLKQLAEDRSATIQELADEAFADLLKKHRRPVGLKAQLKASSAESLPRRRRPRR